MMEEVPISDADIQKVMRRLRATYSDIHSKEWTFGDSILGIYIHDEYAFRINSTLTTTVIIEYDTLQASGKATIVVSGGKTGLLGFSWGVLKDRMKDAKKMVLALLDPQAPDLGKIKCPACGAAYVYNISPDSESVNCQNCGKPIVLDASSQPTTDGLEIR
jgi:hypothetical protein